MGDDTDAGASAQHPYPPKQAPKTAVWISEARLYSSHAPGAPHLFSRRVLAAVPDLTDASPRFAHESEAELARIFDYYRIAWRYEPHTFPISWNAAGELTESFAPDFYLPEIDLYVELTTLKQGLVRKKNRKLRYLRQLYPELRIKLFYARDFKALMLKYGRLSFLRESMVPPDDFALSSSWAAASSNAAAAAANDSGVAPNGPHDGRSDGTTGSDVGGTAVSGGGTRRGARRRAPMAVVAE